MLAGFQLASFAEWDYREEAGEPPFGLEEPLIDVHCELLCTYERTDDAVIDIADFAHFARAETPRDVWPYWRELAHAVLLRAGLTELPHSLRDAPPLFGPHHRTHQLDMDPDWSRRSLFAEYAETLGVRTDQVFSRRIEGGQEWVIFTTDDITSGATPTFLGAALYRDDDGVLHEVDRMTPGPEIQAETLKDFERLLQREGSGSTSESRDND
jgi:hypothetical protein